MRTFLFLVIAGSTLFATSLAQAAGPGGGMGGGGMGGGQCGGGQRTGGMAQSPGGANLSQSPMSSLLGPHQAYLQAAAAMSAYQAQQREQRVTQHNAVYQKRREEAVAARQAALRSQRSQTP